MTWVKIDDRMPEHPKVAGLSDRAFRAHFEALCYCAGSLTDGLIPAAVVKVRRWSRSTVELVEARLWEVTEGGWRVHNYLLHQRSKADADHLSEVRAEAGAKGGKAQANGKQVASPLLKQIREEEIRSEPNPTDSASQTRARVKVITLEERAHLHERYLPIATVEEIDEQIELSLAHSAVKKTTRVDLYVNNWLRRSFEGRNGRTTGGGAAAAGGRAYTGPAGARGVAAGGAGRGAAERSEYADDF